MKKRIALIAALAALAIPTSPQAQRAWLAPTSPVLSGTDASVRAAASGEQLASNAQYNGIMEVLP